MNHYQLIFDTSCGASGDMLLAALLDLQPLADDFIRNFTGLGLEVGIECRAAEKNHLKCTQVLITTAANEKLRFFSDIGAFIEKSPFSEAVKSHALRIFERIFQAEAAVHGESMKDIHLHELGADDSLVDILGFCWLWERLGFPPILFTTLYTGRGHVQTRHGRLPVPPPAVLKLIEGCRSKTGEIEAEILTPTGAAILTTLGRQIGGEHVITAVKTGTGCGQRTFPEAPNILRAILSVSEPEGTPDSVWVMEFFLDDMTGEMLGVLGDKLLTAGSLDFFVAAGQMKKGRSGYHVTVLCPEPAYQKVTEAIFSESTTIGLRLRRENRMVLERQEKEVQIGQSRVRYKVASFSGREFNRKPEFADVEALAKERQISYKEAYNLAMRMIHEKDEHE